MGVVILRDTTRTHHIRRQSSAFLRSSRTFCVQRPIQDSGPVGEAVQVELIEAGLLKWRSGGFF